MLDKETSLRSDEINRQSRVVKKTHYVFFPIRNQEVEESCSRMKLSKPSSGTISIFSA